MVPSFSAWVPMRKPGLSTKFTTGRWNVSQRSTIFVIFSAPAAVRAPPECIGSLAITPTGYPSSRATPATSEGPYFGAISKNES